LRFLVVWLDKLGIIDIEFMASTNIDLARPGCKWEYAFAVTGDNISVKSKVCALDISGNFALLIHVRVSFSRALPTPMMFFLGIFGIARIRQDSANLSRMFVSQMQAKTFSSVTSFG
jgi:hypothetical protein